MGERVLLRLNDGVVFLVHARLEEFAGTWRAALSAGVVIQVDNGAGRVRCVNPHQIMYAEPAELGRA